MSNIKKYFLTFGAPTENFHNAVKRICKQAYQMNVFDEIIGLTEKDLMNDSEFWTKHCKFIESNSRGYGYYVWKPYIIKKTLEKMNDGDILLFVDSGCELNPKGQKKLLEYFNLVKTKKIIGTCACSTDYNYTKKDLINFMQMENNVDLLKLNQMQSGCVMLIKCDEIVKLHEEYYTIASNNYNLIDDSPSVDKNYDGFKENRHDQSVFSLLVKKYGLINYCLDPTDWGYGHEAKYSYLSHGMEYPIWTCRNRSGKSILE